ncbi:VWA domain-containing protein, partial [Halomonas pacifica]|uniref:VWA domain-containing protein n=1 Tax=Bisbaumannia pacifica TaxID=77098 RepID=UPI00235A2825
VAFTPDTGSLEDGFVGSIGFASKAGADGVGSVLFTIPEGEPATDIGGQQLFLEDEPLFYEYDNGDQSVIYARTEGGVDGFKIELDADADTYTITVYGKILNGTEQVVAIGDGVGGSNSTVYGLNVGDGIDNNDVLVSTQAGETVNNSTGKGVGISQAQSITDGEVARFDFVTGLNVSGAGDSASWTQSLDVTRFSQEVVVTGGGNATTTLTINALENVADTSIPQNGGIVGSGDYLTLTPDMVRVYDTSGGDVTASMTITQDGDGIQVAGIKEGYSYELITETPFQTIEITGGDDADFNLGDFIYFQGGTATDIEMSLPIKGIDGDGDSVSGALDIVAPEPDMLLVGGNIDNSLESSGGNDILIGDVGGTFTVIDPAKDYNISLIVDTSGSMGDASGTPGLSRMELAKAALSNLAEQLAGFEGTINLQIIDFATNAVSESYLGISTSDLNAINDFIDSMDDGGGTNYEAGFNAASTWLNSQSNGFINQVFFLTDGDPTYYLDDDDDVAGPGSSTTQAVMDNSLEAFDALVAAGDNGTLVEAVGIGSGVNTDILQFFDNTAVVGQTTASGSSWTVTADAGELIIVNTDEELEAALQGGSSSNEPAEVGDDTLIGGSGDDILFGDAIAPAGSPELGYQGVIDVIKAGNGGVEPSDQEIMDYIRNNSNQIETPADQGGSDTLIGGAGNDTLYGGAGADTFVWNLGDQGVDSDPAEDTVMDFTEGDYGSDAEADKLDLSDLLSNMTAGDELSSYLQATDDGTNTTLHISSTGGMSPGDVTAADQTILLEGIVTTIASLQGNNQLDID